MTLGVMDLFAGAGGASQGVKQTEGFEIVGAVDNDEEACEVYDDNHSITPWKQDLTKVSYDDILSHFCLNETDVNVVIGCPPCQSFSSLRDTDPWEKDEPRDKLLKTFLRLIGEGKPPMVLFENVPGFVQKNDCKYVSKLMDRMEEYGYGVDFELTNAANYGVPQARKRSIAICIQGADNEEVNIPKPTHAPPKEANAKGMKPYRTVADTINVDWLAELERGEKDKRDNAHRARRHHDSTMEIIRAIPKDGGSRTDLPDELELDCHADVGTAAGNVYGRMEWDEPAPTLTTRCTTPSTGRFLHPEQDRSITFREAALLMTFPEDYELPNKNSVAESVVGNAVPPDLVNSLLSRIPRELIQNTPEIQAD
jgi:DNA (cytosine-5)-methyltransferase 1